MRTYVYIDGFNLFNGRLSKTRFKWLDVCKFAHAVCDLLGEDYSGNGEPFVRYYTSPIKRAFSTRPESAPKNQNDYLLALKHVCGENLEIYKGRFNHCRFWAYDAQPDAPTVSEQLKPTVRVWRLEEKRVDVKLGSDLISDAIQKSASAQIVVSNDEDIAPAIETTIALIPNMKIGLVTPSQKNAKGGLTRAPNQLLVKATGRNDVLPFVNDSILAECLLPTPVRRQKRHIYCPDDWS